MINDKFLDVCFEHECPNYGQCALNIDFINAGALFLTQNPDCRYFYLKTNGISMRGSDDQEASDEEMWKAFSKLTLDKS